MRQLLEISPDCNRCYCISLDNKKTRNALIHAGLWASLDFLKLIDGARGRNRTGTLLPTRDFESRASTNSATRAYGIYITV